MRAPPLDSEFRDGVIHVVPATKGIVAVCLEGEFDLAQAATLADQITHALDTGRGLVVDLSEATFVDSTIIEVLVRAAQEAAGQTKTVVLQLGTATVVGRTIEIVGVERVLRCAHSRQEAVRVIQQQHDGYASGTNNEDAPGHAGDGRAARHIALAAVNDQIHRLASESSADELTWEFFCECGSPGCRARTILTIDAYLQHRDDTRAILAPGHRIE